MTADHRHGHLESIRSALSVVVYPLQVAVDAPVQGWHWAEGALAARAGLLDENERLKSERLLLNSRLQRFLVLEEENRRLRQLLESSSRFEDRVLVAELVAVEVEPFRRQVVINKGTREQVYDGQPVLDAEGIVGQIVHVGPLSSSVLLITDPSHALPVQINRNGLRAIAVGTGQDDALLLEHLPRNSDINPGDLVVTSGLGGRFPRGYPVGTVHDVQLDPGEPFARVTVTPSAQLARSREVLLLWPQDDVDVSVPGRDVAALP
jgi:rod shape-determining protein MreC